MSYGTTHFFYIRDHFDADTCENESFFIFCFLFIPFHLFSEEGSLHFMVLFIRLLTCENYVNNVD